MVKYLKALDFAESVYRLMIVGGAFWAGGWAGVLIAVGFMGLITNLFMHLWDRIHESFHLLFKMITQ